MNILTAKHAHLVGIKGVAMASLAQCLDDIGIRVSGSDVDQDFVTAQILATRNFQIESGFERNHISPDCDLVVYTGAHGGSTNIEVLEAKKRGIPVLSHAEALGALMEGKKAISVCGTGGKSTTSAMIAWILHDAGFHPSFSVGVGNMPNLSATGRYEQYYSENNEDISNAGWFVAEADEYAVDPTSDHRPRFIYQHPNIIVVPNLSYDHPDIYPSFDQMQKVFVDFFSQKDSFLVVNGDNDFLSSPAIFKIGPHMSAGFLDRNMCCIQDYQVHEKVQMANLVCALPHESKKTFHLSLCIPGKHNMHNAALAFLASIRAGVHPQKAIDALSRFRGTMRRFEQKKDIFGCPAYDDYAHTPDEITATLSALKVWEKGKKIVCIFQPHTFSRTKALYSGFVKALAAADEVFLLDIFASARESFDASVSSKQLALDIGKTATYASSLQDVQGSIQKNRHSDVVYITMGAGDVYILHDMIQELV